MISMNSYKSPHSLSPIKFTLNGFAEIKHLEFLKDLQNIFACRRVLSGVDQYLLSANCFKSKKFLFFSHFSLLKYSKKFQSNNPKIHLDL